MAYIDSIIEVLKKEFSVFKAVIIALIIFLIINFFLRGIKARMLKKAASKIQISNIKLFFRILQLVLAIVVATIAFFYYFGSWTGLGIFAGLLTAALGFALQKPIAGVAAWLIIAVKRPFQVGDRIKIADIRGEVYDITLTHLYLDEIGGDVDSEDFSGRNVAIPNHMLFDNPIINYTLLNDFVLTEVAVDITYESNLDKAMQLCREVAKKYTENFEKESKKETKIRVAMNPSSMSLKIRFFCPIRQVSRVKSDINLELYNRIKREPLVDIAYPHTEFVMRKTMDNPLTSEDSSQKEKKE